jgi:Tol biopolymer transport system component
MAVRAGERLGPYKILSLLASGGMGEVYRARDTRLDRTVAVKVLPAAFAANPVRRERFEREARAIATLAHPHICALYDVGHQDGVDFLVFEHLEGETLASRLRRGPIPADQAVRYGMELADALDEAHRRGIVHRDLKPANIMITSTGAKLLDFGLAQLLGREVLSSAGGPPGETVSLTTEGTILGTVQYMAPEQVEGRETDHRADIFALGAVLYELVTGEKAFKGESPASQMAAILNSDPRPVSVVQPDAGVSRAFDHVVQRCLSKDPGERWQSAHDVMLELAWLGGTVPSATEPTVSGRWRVHSRLGWAVAASLGAVTLALAVLVVSGGDADVARSTEQVRFTVAAPENGALSTGTFLMALSPDGRHLAFVASAPGGPPFLWIRPLDSVTAHALAGTEGATAPFWSPDGRSVAFVADGKLKRIDIEGATPVVLASDAAPFPGAWGAEGVILFFRGAHGILGNISKVSAQGGEVAAATTLDATRGEVADSEPRFLPDGRHFLFVAGGTKNVLCLASLDSTARLRTMAVESFDTRYVEPGYLLWHRGGTVLAQPFDVSAFRLSGRPASIATQVRYHMGTDSAVYSASSTGILAYRSVATTRLTWFDRHGTPAGWVGPPGSYSDPSLSHDGKRLAVCQLDPETGTRDIWLCDVERGVWSRLSFNPADDIRPVWSSDDRRVLFASNRNGFFDLFVRNIEQGAEDELVENTPPHKWPIDWSPDGRFILYMNAMSLHASILPLGGKPTEAPTAFAEATPGDRLSGDGRWLAFSVRRTPGVAPDVYVTSFPAGDHTERISSSGGIDPKWRRDGKELFYLAPDGRLMAVQVDGAREFKHGAPQPLFQTTLSVPAPNSPESRRQYDVTPDGQRFLLNQPLGDTPLTIVLNWTATLSR